MRPWTVRKFRQEIFLRFEVFTAVKMKAAGSAETLTPFYQTTWRSMPDDSGL
jgi:hypothetical protein